jgi:hypothetical protein
MNTEGCVRKAWDEIVYPAHKLQLGRTTGQTLDLLSNVSLIPIADHPKTQPWGAPRRQADRTEKQIKPLTPSPPSVRAMADKDQSVAPERRSSLLEGGEALLRNSNARGHNQRWMVSWD